MTICKKKIFHILRWAFIVLIWIWNFYSFGKIIYNKGYSAGYSTGYHDCTEFVIKEIKNITGDK
jgi:hypothetical protein